MVLEEDPSNYLFFCMTNNNSARWITMKQAQVRLGVGRTSMYKLRRDHKLKWSTIGRKVYVLNTSIDELLDSNSSEFQFNKLEKE